MPVEEAIVRCEAIQRDVVGHPASEAEILRWLGGLHGLAGRFALARSLFAERRTAFAGLAKGLYSVFSTVEGITEMLAGDFEAAERGLRESDKAYEEMGERANRSTTAGSLARAIMVQGRHDEAERLTELSEELAEPDDFATQILWRSVRARLLAARGRALRGRAARARRGNPRREHRVRQLPRRCADRPRSRSRSRQPHC